MARKYRVIDKYNKELLSLPPHVSLRDAQYVVSVFFGKRHPIIERYDEKRDEWVPYESASTRNKSGRSLKYTVVTIDPMTQRTISRLGRWVSRRQADTVADAWERHGTSNVCVIDESGHVVRQPLSSNLPSNRNRSGRRDPFGYRAMMKERAAREKEEAKLKRWGVFPYTEDGGIIDASRGYVVREADENTGRGTHAPYRGVDAVRVFKRFADADKLAHKMTFGGSR